MDTVLDSPAFRAKEGGRERIVADPIGNLAVCELIGSPGYQSGRVGDTADGYI